MNECGFYSFIQFATITNITITTETLLLTYIRVVNQQRGIARQHEDEWRVWLCIFECNQNTRLAYYFFFSCLNVCGFVCVVCVTWINQRCQSLASKLSIAVGSFTHTHTHTRPFLWLLYLEQKSYRCWINKMQPLQTQIEKLQWQRTHTHERTHTYPRKRANKHTFTRIYVYNKLNSYTDRHKYTSHLPAVTWTAGYPNDEFQNTYPCSIYADSLWLCICV